MTLAIAEPQVVDLVDRLQDLEQAVGDVHDLDQVVELLQLTDGLAQLARIARRSLAEQNRVVRLRLEVAHRRGTLLRQLASQPRPGRAKGAPRGP